MTTALKDRVLETSTTTGTGTYDLAGSDPGFLGIVEAIGDGSSSLFAITADNKWEIIEGTVTSSAPDTLTRDVILSSSNGGSAVNWLGGDSTRSIRIILPSDAVSSLIDQGAPNGLVTRTAKNVYTGRSIIGGIGIDLTDGDGVSGNPTIDFDIDIVITETAVCPRGWIDGFQMVRNGSNSHDLDVGPGLCRNDDDDSTIRRTSLITKQADAPWVVGSAAGGLSDAQIDGAETVTFTDNGASDDFVTIDSGTWTVTPSVGDLLIVTGGVNAGTYLITAATTTQIDVATASFTADANSTSAIRHLRKDGWYGIWAVKRSDTGVVDVIIDSSFTAPNMPTNYDKKLRIGAVLTNGTPNIVEFRQVGEYFWWTTPVLDLKASATSGVQTNVTVTAPPTVSHWIGLTQFNTGSVGAVHNLEVGSPNDILGGDLSNRKTHELKADTEWSSVEHIIETNTTPQIAYKTDSTQQLIVITRGWIDSRGRNV